MLLLVPPVLFMLRRVKHSAVKKASRCLTLQWSWLCSNLGLVLLVYTSCKVLYVMCSILDLTGIISNNKWHLLLAQLEAFPEDILLKIKNTFPINPCHKPNVASKVKVYSVCCAIWHKISLWWSYLFTASSYRLKLNVLSDPPQVANTNSQAV